MSDTQADHLCATRLSIASMLILYTKFTSTHESESEKLSNAARDLNQHRSSMLLSLYG